MPVPVSVFCCFERYLKKHCMIVINSYFYLFLKCSSVWQVSCDQKSEYVFVWWPVLCLSHYFHLVLSLITKYLKPHLTVWKKKKQPFNFRKIMIAIFSTFVMITVILAKPAKENITKKQTGLPQCMINSVTVTSDVAVLHSKGNFESCKGVEGKENAGWNSQQLAGFFPNRLPVSQTTSYLT